MKRRRRDTKGWSGNIESELRTLKRNLMDEYDSLDVKAEADQLSMEEQARLKDIYAEMHNL
jgi:hypothetical protein